MLTTRPTDLGLGVGWRPELALWIERYPALGFVEITAEHFPDCHLPAALGNLGKPIIPHGLSLSLGGADAPEPRRLDFLNRLARAAGAPLISEHLAFVRSEGLESGHLLPVPRERGSLEILVENVRSAQRQLEVPLALENIATLLEWPGNELDEAEFLAELLERTDCQLLLDVSNLFANAHNHGFDALDFLERLPLSRLAYLHVGGGHFHQGVYHDTHGDPVPKPVLELLSEVCRRVQPPGVLLERDSAFPAQAAFEEEMEAIREAVAQARAGSPATQESPECASN